MKKLFISQPMCCRDPEDILAERKQIMEIFSGYEELPSYNEENKNGRTPLYALGSAIQQLAKADLAIFAKDWQAARGCNIEHRCCEWYGIPYIEIGNLTTREDIDKWINSDRDIACYATNN